MITETTPAESAGAGGGGAEGEEAPVAWMKAPAGDVSVRAGEDALLTCVVQGARGRPVLWRRARDMQVLTAGAVRVDGNKRIHVLHDDCCGWESLMKSVTLGNVTMSHRTRERPADALRLSHSTMIGLPRAHTRE
ncbi:hypothetical protein EVAR_40789_1 [Eumeta japonica]|uniref:Ig-like domain-containing protein n=1 Tax=Eumeta variegata TaxID=151549 RepID=A0A4C1X476_EUMVA|nr:hypothetical protein EVAR_40789_1 [Eumeta japonica]